MSHFAVLVIGPDVDEQMAPFHEFECTGRDDQYVQEVDRTSDAIAEFNKSTSKMVRLESGKLVSAYDDMFYREPTAEEAKIVGMGHGTNGDLYWTSKDWEDGKGYRAKVRDYGNYNVVDVPQKEMKDFTTWVKDWYGWETVNYGEKPNVLETHKYGYIMLDENGVAVKCVDRTNPNKKWDWYQVGGRWNGFFKLKAGALGIVGEPGLQSINKDYKHPDETRADQCLKSDVDIDAMRKECEEQAIAEYDLFESLTANLPKHESWDVIRERHPEDIEQARSEYNQQPVVQALRDNKETIWWEPDRFLVSREEYIQRARDNAITTFAILKDGKWYEKGTMGWWAIVTNEKDDWSRQFNKLFDELPDDTLLTVVDCHI